MDNRKFGITGVVLGVVIIFLLQIFDKLSNDAALIGCILLLIWQQVVYLKRKV